MDFEPNFSANSVTYARPLSHFSGVRVGEASKEVHDLIRTVLFGCRRPESPNCANELLSTVLTELRALAKPLPFTREGRSLLPNMIQEIRRSRGQTLSRLGGFWFP